MQQQYRNTLNVNLHVKFFALFEPGVEIGVKFKNNTVDIQMTLKLRLMAKSKAVVRSRKEYGLKK